MFFYKITLWWLEFKEKKVFSDLIKKCKTKFYSDFLFMTSIFVAKLDFGISSDQLRQMFQQYGTVLKATVAMDRETGKSRGFGFVEMANREEAMSAIKQLDGFNVNGRPIAVKEAEQRGDSRPPRDSNDSRPREQFRPNDGANRSADRSSDTRRPDDNRSYTPPPAIEPSKIETRKKEKERKPLDHDSEGRSKKPKMNAYKKSGKNNRFFGDDDDDDDWDVNSASLFDTDDDFDDDEEFDDEEEN
jgi:RNA recognition motif-containing protein